MKQNPNPVLNEIGPKGHVRLTLLFSLIVFLGQTATVVLTYFLVLYLNNKGILVPRIGRNSLLGIFIFTSILIGIFISVLVTRIFFRPLMRIMYATDEIAKGNFKVRVKEDGFPDFRKLCHKFNHMAEELDSVELLRTDFVDNFSHEFKTPIVSILGFAKMLKNNSLTTKERNEYLDIIIEEGERLTSMSTNVLLLSNVEGQSILTDRENFNITEQIRQAVILLYNKSLKNQNEFDLQGEEMTLNGNQELLKQVWINLLNNALKFSLPDSPIEIKIEQEGKFARIEIRNLCKPIPQENLEHIFEKYYQLDTSHAKSGNGLGLAICKRIIELHKGTIEVKSIWNEITFTVRLPIKAQ